MESVLSPISPEGFRFTWIKLLENGKGMSKSRAPCLESNGSSRIIDPDIKLDNASRVDSSP